MRHRLSPPPYPADVAAQLTAFWHGVAALEVKYDMYFTSTLSRRSSWSEPQPSTLAENLVLQCTKTPVRLSLHPHLPEEIARDTRALFQQLFGQ
ncbi:hypothetical protein [Hymenobacter crusticola]|uniref:Uncharacterized protein n=1 Tax=Hymenobacter crusticola TaxID=1770526 RepID=A0A2C9ZTP3_9BACT|nr:hypothetical protein [Hymenobacter crusticola]OUJ67739.1 hypothetical protein BXP70_28635 [Hymenobacter crusticola]